MDYPGPLSYARAPNEQGVPLLYFLAFVEKGQGAHTELLCEPAAAPLPARKPMRNRERRLVMHHTRGSLKGWTKWSPVHVLPPGRRFSKPDLPKI